MSLIDFFAFTYLIFDSVPLTKAGTVSSQTCIVYLMSDNLVTLITTLTVQGILQLRVYALYNRSKKILLFLLTLCVVEVAAMVVLAGITLSHLEHLPIASTSTGCYYKGLLGLSAVFWVPGLIYEPILFGLVAFKAWPLKTKGMSVPLVTRIARDSLLYFIVIFAELLISTVIWAQAPTYINIMMPWSAALPSVLGGRLLLNMREMALAQGGHTYVLETLISAPLCSDQDELWEGDSVER